MYSNIILVSILLIYKNCCRNVGPPLEPRTSGPVIDRRRLKELIEQLNTLNVRLEPFYSQYCHYITDDPDFATIEVGSYFLYSYFNLF